METAPSDQDNFQAEPTEENNHVDQTRREFIRGLLIKSAYAAPIITTFSVATVNSAHAEEEESGSGGSKYSRKSSGEEGSS